MVNIFSIIENAMQEEIKKKTEKYCAQRHDFSLETRQRIDWFDKKLLFMYKHGCQFFSRIQIQCTLFSIAPKSKAKQTNK